MKVRFVIPGPPFGKQRPRVYPNKSGIGSHAVTPKKTVVYENLVRTSYCQQCKSYRFDDVMLDVRIIAYYPIPKSTSKKKRAQMLAGDIRPTKKPDFDNIGKVVCDSLNQVAYHNDAQIVDAQVRKFFSDRPRVQVTIAEAKPKREEENADEQGT